MNMVLSSFQHPHPRVRWAAINAIGQLSTDLGPDLQVQYHQHVLPALAGAMDDFQNPRVQVCLILFIYELISNCFLLILDCEIDEYRYRVYVSIILPLGFCLHVF